MTQLIVSSPNPAPLKEGEAPGDGDLLPARHEGSPYQDVLEQSGPWSHSPRFRRCAARG